jgi:hypothetical protein
LTAFGGAFSRPGGLISSTGTELSAPDRRTALQSGRITLPGTRRHGESRDKASRIERDPETCKTTAEPRRGN